MVGQSRHIRILMADDDEDECILTKRAFSKVCRVHEMTFVADGEQLIQYLLRKPPFEDATEPDLVLLDLNMPRMDGCAALSEIKNDPTLRHIPIVVLTTSKTEKDVLESYRLGVNSYIVKPVTYDQLLRMAKSLGNYWFELVELPTKHHREIYL